MEDRLLNWLCIKAGGDLIIRISDLGVKGKY